MLLGLAPLLVAFNVHAVASNNSLYGVNLSASLSTQSVSGSTNSVHTAHVSNKTITDAVFLSSTTNVAKASDLALVIDNSLTLAVIDTSSTNDAIVAVIAQTGSNATQSAISATTKTGLLSLTESWTDHEFTLPGVATVQVTNFRITAKVNLVTQTISQMLISFDGGQQLNVAGATYFQGTIKQTGKTYISVHDL